MYIGEYTYNTDPKGRVALPPKFRAELGREIILTRGLERCLWVYPVKEWETLAERLAKLPAAQKEARAFVRLMLAGARSVEIDSQGRILIPDYLRIYAVIGKKAVVIGLYNRIEIWDENSWLSYRNRTEQESGDIADKLSELGFGI